MALRVNKIMLAEKQQEIGKLLEDNGIEEMKIFGTLAGSAYSHHDLQYILTYKDKTLGGLQEGDIFEKVDDGLIKLLTPKDKYDIEYYIETVCQFEQYLNKDGTFTPTSFGINPVGIMHSLMKFPVVTLKSLFKEGDELILLRDQYLQHLKGSNILTFKTVDEKEILEKLTVQQQKSLLWIYENCSKIKESDSARRFKQDVYGSLDEKQQKIFDRAVKLGKLLMLIKNKCEKSKKQSHNSILLLQSQHDVGSKKIEDEIDKVLQQIKRGFLNSEKLEQQRILKVLKSALVIQEKLNV